MICQREEFTAMENWRITQCSDCCYLSRDDSAHSWDDALVEALRALIDEDLLEAIHSASVLLGLRALHLGLHDIKWIVTNCGEAACHHASYKRFQRSHRNLPVLRDDILVLIEEHEPQPLVTALLQNSGSKPLI